MIVEEALEIEGLTRRAFTAGGIASVALLAGCQTTTTAFGPPAFGTRRYHALAYAAKKDEKFPLPAIDIESFDQRYLRRRVDYKTKERPGTVVVEPHNRFLYLVEPNGKAIRYGVGVGRAGFQWSGRARIGHKRAWPTWTPPAAMIRRRPELAKWARGMPPGLKNPLGARALYLYQGGRDTLYRLHGTDSPKSIGGANSSGCVRMWNQDIIDLYDRVKIGARVIVKA
ncbi:MAG: L,D-transpeptidase [Pseudomonadota bacterium]